MRKGLVNGTKVLTSKGYVKVEDLKVGDIVYDHNGHVQKVRKVRPGEKVNVKLLVLNDGTIIRCYYGYLVSHYEDNLQVVDTLENIKVKAKDSEVYVVTPKIDLLHDEELYQEGCGWLDNITWGPSESFEKLKNIPEEYKHDLKLLSDIRNGVCRMGGFSRVKHLSMALDIKDCAERAGFRVEVWDDGKWHYVTLFHDKLCIKDIIETNDIEDTTEVEVTGLAGTFVIEHCLI